MWETDEEKEKLMFYLYFTSIYIIYLKDKNFGLDDNEDNFYDEENGQVEFNFSSWTKKINNLLDSSKNMDDIDIDELYLVKNKRLKSNAILSMKSIIYPKNKANKHIIGFIMIKFIALQIIILCIIIIIYLILKRKRENIIYPIIQKIMLQFVKTGTILN